MVEIKDERNFAYTSKIRPQYTTDIELGKFISLILRHKPDKIGITLNQHGWADTYELIKGINNSGKYINITILERIVQENDKNRFSFNEEHTKIRANQGHSIIVDLQLKEAIPPDILYHGTAVKYVKSIQRNGICKQSRQYVHLSLDYNTALFVGSRHGKPIVFSIDAKAMKERGYTFYLSENNIWLCDNIPVAYLNLCSRKSSTYI